MNNMIIMKAKTEFDVHVTAKVPEVGDKWEDDEYVYTITGVTELILSQCWFTPYYVVNVDLFDKEIYSPTEPETILMELDKE